MSQTFFQKLAGMKTAKTTVKVPEKIEAPEVEKVIEKPVVEKELD